jgi:hypothetical protein
MKEAGRGIFLLPMLGCLFTNGEISPAVSVDTSASVVAAVGKGVGGTAATAALAAAAASEMIFPDFVRTRGSAAALPSLSVFTGREKVEGSRETS